MDSYSHPAGLDWLFGWFYLFSLKIFLLLLQSRFCREEEEKIVQLIEFSDSEEKKIQDDYFLLDFVFLQKPEVESFLMLITMCQNIHSFIHAFVIVVKI